MGAGSEFAPAFALVELVDEDQEFALVEQDLCGRPDADASWAAGRGERSAAALLLDRPVGYEPRAANSS